MERKEEHYVPFRAYSDYEDMEHAENRGRNLDDCQNEEFAVITHQPIFSCDECGKSFISKRGLMVHVENRHTLEGTGTRVSRMVTERSTHDPITRSVNVDSDDLCFVLEKFPDAYPVFVKKKLEESLSKYFGERSKAVKEVVHILDMGSYPTRQEPSPQKVNISRNSDVESSCQVPYALQKSAVGTRPVSSSTISSTMTADKDRLQSSSRAHSPQAATPSTISAGMRLSPSSSVTKRTSTDKVHLKFYVVDRSGSLVGRIFRNAIGGPSGYIDLWLSKESSVFQWAFQLEKEFKNISGLETAISLHQNGQMKLKSDQTFEDLKQEFVRLKIPTKKWKLFVSIPKSETEIQECYHKRKELHIHVLDKNRHLVRRVFHTTGKTMCDFITIWVSPESTVRQWAGQTEKQFRGLSGLERSMSLNCGETERLPQSYRFEDLRKHYSQSKQSTIRWKLYVNIPKKKEWIKTAYRGKPWRFKAKNKAKCTSTIAQKAPVKKTNLRKNTESPMMNSSKVIPMDTTDASTKEALGQTESITKMQTPVKAMSPGRISVAVASPEETTGSEKHFIGEGTQIKTKATSSESHVYTAVSSPKERTENEEQFIGEGTPTKATSPGRKSVAVSSPKETKGIDWEGTPTKAKFCHNCGQPLLSHFKFCTQCGKPVETATVQEKGMYNGGQSQHNVPIQHQNLTKEAKDARWPSQKRMKNWKLYKEAKDENENNPQSKHHQVSIGSAPYIMTSKLQVETPVESVMTEKKDEKLVYQSTSDNVGNVPSSLQETPNLASIKVPEPMEDDTETCPSTGSFEFAPDSGTAHEETSKPQPQTSKVTATMTTATNDTDEVVKEIDQLIDKIGDPKSADRNKDSDVKYTVVETVQSQSAKSVLDKTTGSDASCTDQRKQAENTSSINLGYSRHVNFVKVSDVEKALVLDAHKKQLSIDYIIDNVYISRPALFHQISASADTADKKALVKVRKRIHGIIARARNQEKRKQEQEVLEKYMKLTDFEQFGLSAQEAIGTAAQEGSDTVSAEDIISSEHRLASPTLNPQVLPSGLMANATSSNTQSAATVGGGLRTITTASMPSGMTTVKAEHVTTPTASITEVLAETPTKQLELTNQERKSFKQDPGTSERQIQQLQSGTSGVKSEHNSGRASMQMSTYSSTAARTSSTDTTTKDRNSASPTLPTYSNIMTKETASGATRSSVPSTAVTVTLTTVGLSHLTSTEPATSNVEMRTENTSVSSIIPMVETRTATPASRTETALRSVPGTSAAEESSGMHSQNQLSGEYAEQLQTLAELGFKDRALNKIVIRAAEGNIENAIDLLLGHDSLKEHNA